VWFLPLLSFSALSARVQLSPFPRVTHASVVFSRLDEFFFDSCCLFTCLGTLVGIFNFFLFRHFTHTRPILAPSARAGRVGSQEQARVSRHVSNTSQQREREREKIVGIILLARQRSA
jgi:hypothetical protein